MFLSTSLRILHRIARSTHRAPQILTSFSTPSPFAAYSEFSSLPGLSRTLTPQVLSGPLLTLRGQPRLRHSSLKPQLSEGDVRERVMRVCQSFEKVNPDKIKADTHFMKDLGLDSLDHVELIMAMEDEFGFEISDQDAEQLVRPGDIVKYVHLRLTPLPAD